LLDAVRDGDPGARDDLVRAVYDDLRRIAQARLGSPNGRTLQATAIVHEAFIRLFRGENASWEHRAHFFFAAARAVHDIVVEDARRRGAIKRGGGLKRFDSANLTLPFETSLEDLLSLDQALHRLEKEDRRSYELVMLRFYVGLNEAQIAEVLGVSTRTVQREWRFAKAWLHQELSGEDGNGDPGG
jgi:RNA polymerase sigma factor (TIGR02999 family)